MARVSGGDLEHRVPDGASDELGHMARSFNQMTRELKVTYQDLRQEQDKLTTIILGAGEGIVVTDRLGTIVLVNPAAERLLGKDAETIIEEGFDQLFGDPATMRRWSSPKVWRGWWPKACAAPTTTTTTSKGSRPPACRFWMPRS